MMETWPEKHKTKPFMENLANCLTTMNPHSEWWCGGKVGMERKKKQHNKI